MKYVQYINSLLKNIIQKEKDLIIYGQNINAGSCISGLTRGLGDINSGFTINTPNSENTLTGIGFGLMLNSTSSIFFMKQMDFLLLGIDHLVNTFNIIRQSMPTASFTIFPVNVDSGFEGPQSALNNFNDFCSIADLDGYSFTNKIDTKEIISNYLIRPGFRIISPSQRLLRNDTINLDVFYYDKEFKYFHYMKGDDLSIVCFNYSLPYGISLYKRFKNIQISASLLSINTFSLFDCKYLINELNQTKNLIIIDDSKSTNKMSDKFLNQIYKHCILEKIIVLDRQDEKNRFFPRHDQLEIDYNSVLNKFIK